MLCVTVGLAPPILSLETFNVGFDLFVLAFVTSFTALIDRSSALAQTSRRLSEEEHGTTQAALDVLHRRTESLANGQLLSGGTLFAALLLGVLVASITSEKGYNTPTVAPNRRSKAPPVEPMLTRRGVMWPLTLGPLTLILSLLTSR